MGDGDRLGQQKSNNSEGEYEILLNYFIVEVSREVSNGRAKD